MALFLSLSSILHLVVPSRGQLLLRSAGARSRSVGF